MLINAYSTDYLFADIWATDEAEAYKIAFGLEVSDMRIMSPQSIGIDTITLVTEEDESLEPFEPIN